MSGLLRFSAQPVALYAARSDDFCPVVLPGAHYTQWIGDYLFFQPISGRDQGHTRRG
jgi:hypothetical protein